MESFRRWLESSGSYDQALRRPQFLSPRFHPANHRVVNIGEKQEDPMYHTLHGPKKQNKKDPSPVAKLFGFMRKN